MFDVVVVIFKLVKVKKVVKLKKLVFYFKYFDMIKVVFTVLKEKGGFFR